MTVTAKPWDEVLFRHLRNPEFATAYLQTALADTPEAFLVALRKFVQANGGFTETARLTGLSRETLYRTLSDRGNPGLKQLSAILDACGLQLSLAMKAAS